jgi:hypothetical protein
MTAKDVADICQAEVKEKERLTRPIPSLDSSIIENSLEWRPDCQSGGC